MSANAQDALPLDPVDAALEAIKRLDKALREKCIKDNKLDAEAIARRAKDAPQLILQSGLASTLAFMLSKLDDRKKRRAYADTITCILGEQARGTICTDLSGEGGGYPQVVALLLVYASLVADCDTARLASLSGDLIDCLQRIRDRGVRVEKLVLRYAEEVKKLATALYG